MRVIAACDSNLKRLTDKGLFSRNLYEQVIGTVIRVPPLRERVEDVEVIANHILTEMAARHNMPSKTLSREALQLLNSCQWPGNIKQLQGSSNRPSSTLPAVSSKHPTSNCRENTGSKILEA